LPGFKQLIADYERGKIELIYTKSVSRFGRNCVDFLITLRRLKDLNVEIYFENEKILSSSAAGELMLTIHSAVAQMESKNKSANIKWGIKRSTMNPNSPAFSRICFGYNRDETKNLIINEKESDIVKNIFGWYIQGWSIIRIKKELEVLRIPSPMGKRRWPVRTIADILSNEKYTGDSLYGRTASAEFLATKRFKNDFDDAQRSINHHLPIIDKETFILVQEMKKMRSNIEIDEQGNKVRKTTHYSMKQPLTTIEKTTKL